MNKNVISVAPACDFYSAVNTMHLKNISSLPVVDEHKKLLGIITVTDIMRALLAVFKLFEKAPS
jgi:CBS domain-containing protein